MTHNVQASTPPYPNAVPAPGNWPLQRKGARDRQRLTAVAKGAAIAGLPACIEAARAGYMTKAVDLRPGGQRQNLVSLRPEALRWLDGYGVVESLERRNQITRVVDARIVHDMAGFERPIGLQPDFRSPHYVPQPREQQAGCVLVTLGHLEDALFDAAKDVGVHVVRDATLRLCEHPGTKRRQAFMVSTNNDAPVFDLGFPDLVIGASGKGDLQLLADLGVDRTRGLGADLTPDCMPRAGNLAMQFVGERLERQYAVFFGIQRPSEQQGIFRPRIRKHMVGETAQPLLDVKFTHAGAESALFQLPRGMTPEARDDVRAFVISRLNERLESNFDSLDAAFARYPLMWGQPERPFIMEHCWAERFVYGSNAILAGDAAGSSTPVGGIGADIAATVDAQNIRALVQGLKQRADAKRRGCADSQPTRAALLERYNSAKAESLAMWARISRPFYLSRAQADAIVAATQPKAQAES